MASSQVQVLLDPQADEMTKAAVRDALARAGLRTSLGTEEGKSLRNVPWDQVPWDHVISIVLEQVQGLAEDVRGFFAGVLLERFRQGTPKGELEVEAAGPGLPAPPPPLAAAEQFRVMVQELQQLQVRQANGPILVRLVIGDLWVTCPDAVTSGLAPFLNLLDPHLDVDEVGGFAGATRWDATQQRWVPDE